ncbi:MAG: P-II family nitrogen regulator, partial [Clostridia bacterium]|nr:P-II family nitrogen regulator [Clostridia bacterium]
MANSKFEMILCIVNTGFSETVMDAAKDVGARGGTVIHARGTANKEAEQFFQITIQPDKEIVLILVPAEIKDDVLHAIYRMAGLKTEGQGIAYSLPVDDVVGISKQSADQIIEQAQNGADKTSKDDKADNTVKAQSEETSTDDKP